MIDKIRNETQYNQVLELIENFIKKATKKGGFAYLSKEDANELEALSKLAEQYENNVLHVMPLKITLKALINNKIDEMKINQAALAEMLGLTAPKLSQILNGKRQPDVSFLKAVHTKLGISADFLLESV